MRHINKQIERLPSPPEFRKKGKVKGINVPPF